MESLVCAGVMGIVAFAAYTQSRKHKTANEESKARTWMIVSIIAAAIAVVSIAAAIAG